MDSNNDSTSDTLVYIAFGMGGVLGAAFAEDIALLVIGALSILAFPIYAAFSDTDALEGLIIGAVLGIIEFVIMFIIYALFRHHDYNILSDIWDVLVYIIGWGVVLAVVVGVVGWLTGFFEH